ncbi:MAG: TonB-dependent receptor [Bryobacterales bacterium]|nr:TonB-dependent receptor [Bryobacterales bacterium]
MKACRDKSARLHWLAAVLVLLAAAPMGEANSLNLSGSIAGVVSDIAGTPQMGATVVLFNRYQRVVQRMLTDDRGSFRFESLRPDLYSVRVNLANFLPAVRYNIDIGPGIRQMLNINLASALSSLELVYAAPGQGALMSEDWKWVLRGSLATRPVLRILAEERGGPPGPRDSAFSNTRGMLRLSAGDTGFLGPLGSQPDLGTAFALATSLYGANEVKFSGNLGYASDSGIPAAGFRTTFSRNFDGGASPEVALTMRQTLVAGRAGIGILSGNRHAAPALRTMSLSLYDRTRLSDQLSVDYGATMESVTFLDRLNYFSPFARFSYDLGEMGTVEFGYSSGLPPVELLARNAAALETEQQQDLATLSLFPRMSLRDGRARVQRTENFELGYRRMLGSRTVSMAVYREAVANAALMASSPDGLALGSEYLPDLFSSSSVFNAGSYRTLGYMASLTQALWDGWSATAAYGNGGALHTGRGDVATGAAGEVRGLIRNRRQNWVATRVSGVAPGTKTRFAASYQWTDLRALTPGHFFLTQRVLPEAGLNVSLRQPLPSVAVFNGRLEATAELRNLLAQGYLPLTTGQGRRMQLIHSPRAVRGGLAFIF